MLSAVRVKGTFLRLAAPDRRRQKRWERGGAIRENAGSAERGRDRKSPREQGVCSHGLGCILVGLLWSRLFLNALIGRFFCCIDRSAVSFSVAPLREASPFKRGAADNIRIIVSLSFPRFFESRTGNWPRAERRRFPADKGEAFRLCRPFSRAPDGRFLRRSSFCPHRRFPVSGGKSPLWGKRRQK